MSYQTAVSSIYALGHELAQSPSRKFDLAHMRVLLEALDHPECRFPSVLIAGTNGKGSTAATLASILQASGLRTGLYTSPHLIRINERIKVDGDPITDEAFARIHDLAERTAERLVDARKLPWHPSFFEMMTAIAFAHFAQNRIEIAVLEVGMGGRLDATNVVDPKLSVITDIALDHQAYLGNTLAEIAREKAGIIRESGIVVTLPQTPEANEVIGRVATELNATGVSAVPYVPPVSPASPSVAGVSDAGHMISRYPLRVMGEEILVETPLVGRHQLRNVALAIAAAEELSKQGFAVTAGSIERGVRATQWPGRFQLVPAANGQPRFIFDVAHNPAGAWALRSALSTHYDGRRLIFVFGAMRDKAVREMTEILFPLADRVVATRAENPRAAEPAEIIEAASRTSAEVEPASDVTLALERAKTLAGGDGIIVVTGSIYIVGEAMQSLGVRI